MAKVGLVATVAAVTLTVSPGTAQAYQVAPCSSSGPTAADSMLATRLNSLLHDDMRGQMNAYKVSCARKVVQTVASRGLHPRAAVIAITTTIVESRIQNISEAVDHDSLGLFQQRPSQGWGTRSQILDPVYATNAFLNAMIRIYGSTGWMDEVIGDVCQAVQRSAHGYRYQPQANDAQIIVNLLWNDAVRDWDGDGRADVLARHAGDTDLYLYRGNGSGGFSGSAVNIGNSWSVLDIIFSAGDFDSDGDEDILARHRTTKDLYLYRGNGTGGFSGSTNIGNNWSNFDRIFSPGDFTGDGKADVIARHASSKDLYLYKGNGSGGFSGSAVNIGNNWSNFDIIFSPGDFTGDGKADVIARHASTKDLYLYKGNGSGGFTGSAVNIGNNWSNFDIIFSPGDFTGDGKADVIARHASTKDLYLYKGNGSGGFTGSAVNIGNNWSNFNHIF